VDQRPNASKSLPTLAQELWQLVVGWVRQETIDPVKGLVRYLVFGVMGSLALGVGIVLLVLGGLRALQTETGDTFEGDWSWAPYGITFAGCILVAVLALAARGRRSR
jgi:hypothetical protein